MPDLSPDQFVAQWGRTELKESASAQSHFEAVCRMIGHPLPHEVDPRGESFTYEYGVQKTGGGQGFADVFYRDHFAIEYKGKGKYKDLAEAYQQLLRYRENLYNPPLLVVCDIERWEIHTNWPNTEKRVYKFSNEDLLNPHTRRYVHDLFYSPDRLHPRRNTEQVTTDAARVFQQIADTMRSWHSEPDRIARFLTRLVFCLFAEDVRLLPPGPRGDIGIFSEIVERTRTSPTEFKDYIGQLFGAMADGGSLLFQRIPYFDGLLFADAEVEDVPFEGLNGLAKAASLNWSAVEPAIFGTLFERSLDPSKRAQLGAHYTSRDDILLIVEPVLMAPLRREWAAIQAQAAPIRAAHDAAENDRTRKNRADELKALREGMLKRLREIKVLDPACGSGNFLYVSLNLLLDMEKAVIHDPLFSVLPLPFPEVHPRQLYGIELEPIAHALASIVVWIGYIQWRQNNGYLSVDEPILQPLKDNIVRMDAIMRWGTTEATEGESGISEPDWPEVDVIVGNPPFLGDKKMRGELGDAYVDALRKLYEGRVPGGADLVTYWFERARAQIAAGKAKRAGLLSTNSIRGGANREVLKRIKDSGDIFMAWDDRAWVLEGAAVRVSMVGFDEGAETNRQFNGQKANSISADLTSAVDTTIAKVLTENADLSFIGDQKGGAFDIDASVAKMWIEQSNPSGVSNADVLRPWVNGSDIVQVNRGMWIIDFGAYMPLDQATRYEAVFKYVKENVESARSQLRRDNHRRYWWIHAEARPGMRAKLLPLSRFIATPRVAKHRIFVWINADVLPDSRVYAICRDDDYFFGVLHSKIHEIWSIRQASRHGVGNDPTYNAQSCFETFPFPWPPGSEPTPQPPLQSWRGEQYAAISAAAKTLHEEREAWLKGGGSDRTLTNLYNALNVFRGVEAMKTKASAGDFAPRLDALHRALDVAVCDAYGWPHEVLADDEAILARLLALNLERGAHG